MDTYIPEFGKTLGEELLTPTRLYPRTILPMIKKFDLHGMVHITGGGFYDNIPRTCRKTAMRKSMQTPGKCPPCSRSSRNGAMCR